MPISSVPPRITAFRSRKIDTLKAAFAEFISTLIFVFAGQGSAMAFNKLTNTSAAATPTGLVVASVAHALGLFIAVSVGTNISGGHVNPAVTMAAFLGGNITFFCGLVYIVAQLIGITAACLLLLRFFTGTFSLPGISVWEGLVLQIVMTFGLVYTVYATALDTKKGSLGTITPIAIGLVVWADILVHRASMNPSLVSWSWENQWVYWAGFLIGGGLAAIAYELFFIK